MTLYQFNSLNEEEQAIELWDKGVHIAERRNGELEEMIKEI